MPDEYRESVKFIDIGGGYWPPQGEWLQFVGIKMVIFLKAFGKNIVPHKKHYRIPAVTIEKFADKIGESIHKHILSILDCKICFEPGRWICNAAMQLLLKVIDKKPPDLVITDVGTNSVGWERFETDYFPVINLTQPSFKENNCYILGSLCTPHDVWGYSYWGSVIKSGYILLLPTQGAYTYSLRQNFIKPLPVVITI